MKKLTLLPLPATLFLMLTLLFSAEAQKRYTVFVGLKGGENLKGTLIRTTQDSLSVNIGNFRRVFGVSEIKSIRIRRKGAVGRGVGFGAGTGAFLGGIIGYASYTPPDCSNSWFCLDFGPGLDTIAGGLIGAVGGLLAGALIGSAGKEFKIEGNQAQFDLFANQFR